MYLENDVTLPSLECLAYNLLLIIILIYLASPILSYPIVKTRTLYTIKKEDISSPSMDYSDEGFEIEAYKLTPEEIIARVNVGEKQLKNLNNNPVAFGNMQRNLLMYLGNVRYNNYIALCLINLFIFE